MNVQAAFDDFLLACYADGLKPTTIRWYRSILSAFVQQFGDQELDTITTKDRAATIWADNATVLTDVDWRYVKVMQRDFEQLQPAQFSDCAYLGQTHGSMFED